MQDFQRVVGIVLHLVESVMTLVKEVEDLGGLEERVQKLTQEAAQGLLGWVLEGIDNELLCERGDLRNVGKRKRTIVTMFGEVNFERRLYRDEGGGYHFLLDEAIGVEPWERLSPKMRELSLELGTQVPFRKAAEVMNYLVPGISAMNVWSQIQEAGKKAEEEGQRLAKEVFEYGLVPEGNKKVKRLCVEGDGVWLRQQGGDRPFNEVKLLVGYEAKEDGVLQGRCSVAGLMNGQEAWEQASAKFGQKWSLSDIGEVRVGGDGAAWIKQGLGLFPRSSFHLDSFHLRKRLTEALAYNGEHYDKVSQGVRLLDLKGTMAALDGAMRGTTGARKKRIRSLKTYLKEHWEGIVELPKEERLGAIEGQVRHTLTRRMKRIGARWSHTGADRMARLLAARANGELSGYCQERPSPNWELARSAADNLYRKVSGVDTGEWLQATVPALQGPSAHLPWVKYVLRGLSSYQSKTA